MRPGSDSWQFWTLQYLFADIRMCTACYSKMQREKKKGSTEGIYSERLSSEEVVFDSHHFSVRGSRHASAAARKFIEEFARNKGGWEKAHGSQKRSSGYEEEDIIAHQLASRATELTAGTAMASNAGQSAPKGTAEELFHLARSCCAVGNKILRRDGRFSTQQGTIYVSETEISHSESHKGKLTICEGGRSDTIATRHSKIHAYRHHSEHPDVLQGAADLIHMMKEQSLQAPRVRFVESILPICQPVTIRMSPNAAQSAGFCRCALVDIIG